LCLRAFATISAAVSQNIDVKVSLRTGDRAILIGAAAIVAYEYKVRDDADLISSRVSAYRTKPAGRILTDAIILATALHLAESVPSEWDIYHQAMKWLRRNVGPQE
jgi:hypothetical protein